MPVFDDIWPRMRTRSAGRHVAIIATAVSTIETVLEKISTFSLLSLLRRNDY